MNTPEDLFELIRFVRERSPFYRESYRSVPVEIKTLEQIPIVDQDTFWSANRLENNQVLTSPLNEGLVLRSGGTAGNPKFSVFSRLEWDGFTRDFASGLAKTGVERGDRIANLFYSGELYGSFLFTHKVIELCPVPLVSLPVGGAAPVSEVIRTLLDFHASVIAALPTTIMKLIAQLETDPRLASRLSVRLILFAGEAIYPDQRARIQAALPGVEIRSIGYASNDAGFLGYVDETCGPNEFRRHDLSTIYEIVDEETGEPIHEVGQPGRALVTDLRRRLMPIIRYPVGDLAMWLDTEGSIDRKFRLLGRSAEAGRVASLSIYYDDTRALLEGFREKIGSFQFQIITLHGDSRDGLVLRIGVQGGKPADPELETQILEALYQDRPTLDQFVKNGKLLPARIEWCDLSALETNPRTGKLKRIIDLRIA